jgi:hypothetical protein
LGFCVGLEVAVGNGVKVGVAVGIIRALASSYAPPFIYARQLRVYKIPCNIRYVFALYDLQGSVAQTLLEMGSPRRPNLYLKAG